MRRLTPEELKKILEDHKLWLNDDSKGARANLRYADLSFADLRSADLRFADLRYADLRYADLSFANLRSADLRFADLRFADLRYADLRFANLRSADLRFADLSFANLYHQICPEMGAFIAFKKVKLKDGEYLSRAILTLEIPTDAKRITAVDSRKCRAEKVLVLKAEEVSGPPISETARLYSSHDHAFQYRVGELAIANSFDDDIRKECSNGISFFITRKEAEEYKL